MYAEERQQAIASRVLADGRASVNELAEAYDVTTETVRRDLDVLDKAGVIRRVHGGAVPARTLHLVEQGVVQRDSAQTQQKAAIAAAAVALLPATGGTVLIDAGTTTARIADLIPTDRDLVVITNSIPAAAKLTSNPTVSLQLLGGRVRSLTQAVVGEQALRTLDSLRVDVAFLGTNGISVRHGFSTPDSDEAAIKRAMVRCANHVVVTADSSKFGREDLVSFAPLSAVRTVVTDTEIRAHERQQLADAGVDVICAEAGA